MTVTLKQVDSWCMELIRMMVSIGFLRYLSMKNINGMAMPVRQSKNADSRVVVGSGGSNNNVGWFHTEENVLNLLKRCDWEERFLPNSIAAVLAEHVWEHLTYEEGIDAAKTCYEFLKPGGYVRCAVPDGFFRNTWYQNMVKVGGPGPADHPAASHKIVHTYRTIGSMFAVAGFQVHLLEYCDENGDFHFNDWDENDGFIYRSKRFDHRNQDGELGFVSLIVDAIKPLRWD